MLKLSTGGLALLTIACVLVWCGLAMGAAWLDVPGVLFALFVVPLLPGSPVCIVVGVHSNTCGPAMLIADIAFYLWLVFYIRRRARARYSGIAHELPATGIDTKP
jgi:hypothetical protein